ncbi:MAG: hypothetical protein JRF17_03325 [Deltaproteobacteria bacterium]|nr:hypothetical protein [Deltaproteobacteria bacterium]
MFVRNCHHLKPFGIDDFIGSAVLQGACGSRHQRHPLCLSAPRKPGSYDRQTPPSLYLGI